jgi:hypothetical protein
MLTTQVRPSAEGHKRADLSSDDDDADRGRVGSTAIAEPGGNREENRVRNQNGGTIPGGRVGTRDWAMMISGNRSFFA